MHTFPSVQATNLFWCFVLHSLLFVSSLPGERATTAWQVPRMPRSAAARFVVRFRLRLSVAEHESPESCTVGHRTSMFRKMKGTWHSWYMSILSAGRKLFTFEAKCKPTAQSASVSFYLRMHVGLVFTIVNGKTTR